MPKRSYQTIKKGNSGIGSLIIVFIAIVVILSAGVFAVYFTLNTTIDNVEESAGVIVQINVYGNDLVVTILSGKNIDELRHIMLIIDDTSLPEEIAKKEVKDGETKIEYKSVLSKMTGSHMFGIRGFFEDGKTVMITHKEIRLS